MKKVQLEAQLRLSERAYEAHRSALGAIMGGEKPEASESIQLSDNVRLVFEMYRSKSFHGGVVIVRHDAEVSNRHGYHCAAFDVHYLDDLYTLTRDSGDADRHAIVKRFYQIRNAAYDAEVASG